MVDGLVFLFVNADATGFPESAKPRAGLAQVGDQLCEALVVRVFAGARSQVGDDGFLEFALFDASAYDACGQTGEVAPRYVAVTFGPFVRVADRGGAHRIPDGLVPPGVAEGLRAYREGVH